MGGYFERLYVDTDVPLIDSSPCRKHFNVEFHVCSNLAYGQGVNGKTLLADYGIYDWETTDLTQMTSLFEARPVVFERLRQAGTFKFDSKTLLLAVCLNE